MAEEKTPPEGTRVDLGEDLLEPSRTSTKGSATGTPSLGTPDSDARRGEILFGEKLFSEAKKVFFKILHRDADNARAKEFLAKIHTEEVRELLGVDPNRRKLGAQSLEDDPKKILEALNLDLRLGLERAELRLVPDLFKNQADLEKYKEAVIQKTVPLTLKQRLDFGVAHMEMGLHEVAIEILETVVRYEEHKLAGTYLLCLAQILSGKGIEATLKIEPIVRDLTLDESQKIDFLYLMAMAFESLNDARRAREFYRRVHLLNPRYRNVAEKL